MRMSVIILKTLIDHYIKYRSDDRYDANGVESESASPDPIPTFGVFDLKIILFNLTLRSHKISYRRNQGGYESENNRKMTYVSGY